MHFLMKGTRGPRMAALALGLTVLAACGGSSGTSGPAKAPDSKQILRINTGTQPNSLDPGQQSYDYEGVIGRLTFEALLRPSQDGKGYVGAAASSYDVSSDGLTVTFHLRDNNWSDGKPVTAADFVYGWQRILDPSLAAGYTDPFYDTIVKGADTYSSVDAKDTAAVAKFIAGLGLSAKDDKTFVVQLQHPASWFLGVANLWVGSPIRKDIVTKYGSDKWATVPSQLVTNGKYMVSELVANDHLTLVPNPNYKGDKPQIKQIIAYFITDANTAFNKYKTGDLDILSVPIENTDVVKNDPVLKNQLKVYPAPGGFWTQVNTKVAPFDNVKVRQAVAKAIDRNALTAKVSHGQYVPQSVFIPNGIPGYQGDNSSINDIQKFDPAAAKALLASSGVPASALNIKLITRNTTTNKTLNEYIANQLQTNLGITATIDLTDSKTVTKRIRKGDFQMYSVDGWGMDYANPQDIMDIMMSGACHGTNWGCWSNSEYDKLVTDADGTKDINAALVKYRAAEKILLTDGPLGLLYNRPDYILTKPYVQGTTFTQFDETAYFPGDNYLANLFISNH